MGINEKNSDNEKKGASTSEGGARAPLGHNRALNRKAVKAAAGEAKPVP